LGWVSGASGLCCLQWREKSLQILDICCQQSLEEIVNWIGTWVTAGETALIAVDAPTLIPNASGMRLPDRLTHQYFGRYHAGCYPANRNRPFASRTVAFGETLEKLGFHHAPAIVPQQPGRYQIEVFPHPAIVHLFNLEQILKYKKGRLLERQRELEKLRRYIVEKLPLRQPHLNLNISDSSLFVQSLSECRGRELKVIEDRLDSLICAYVGAHWWYWGKERNWVLGDVNTGYIIVPAPMPGEINDFGRAKAQQQMISRRK
jgi:predicted RNase H-like nuclease